MRGKRKTIVVVTGSRAEFGLLEPVMKAIARRKGLSLRVVVAGWHWMSGTWRDVKQAGFAIDGKVMMQKKRDLFPAEDGLWRGGDVAAVGRGIVGFGKVFAQLKPDVVMVLGDRIEAFAAATAASVGGLRVAHVHGGDRAEGVADEGMRHAISKLAHLHFAATALSCKRLIRMGEVRERVWNVGSPAVDGIIAYRGAARGGGRLIVMQHPVGESDAREKRWMGETLGAVRHLGPVVMGPNGDAGCTGICRAIGDAGRERVAHLPRARWLEMLADALAIVGNSSAGLIEAAVLKVPCVNVGPRQNGREKLGNVVDCDYGRANVRAALVKALMLDLCRMRHPYGDGHAGERIARLLGEMDLSAVSVRKQNAY